MNYRKEAGLRIAYFSLAAIVSVIVAFIVAIIVAKFFPGTNHNSHNAVFNWTFIGVFALVCSVLVYKIDTRFNKRFNTNP